MEDAKVDFGPLIAAKDAKAIVAQLNSTNVWNRRNATGAIRTLDLSGQAKEPFILKALVTMLETETDNIAKLQGLGAMLLLAEAGAADPSAVPLLVRKLDDTAHNFADQALRALAGFAMHGTDISPALEKVRQIFRSVESSRQSRLRDGCVKIVNAGQHDVALRDILLANLSSSDHMRRAVACDILKAYFMNGAGTKAILDKALENYPSDMPGSDGGAIMVITGAAWAKFNVMAVFPAIMQKVNSQDPEVVKQALYDVNDLAIARVLSSSFVPVLRNLLQSADSDISGRANMVLEEYGELPKK